MVDEKEQESITGNSAHRSEPMRGEDKNKDAALRTLPMRGMEHVKDLDAASESTLKRGTFDFTILTTSKKPRSTRGPMEREKRECIFEGSDLHTFRLHTRNEAPHLHPGSYAAIEGSSTLYVLSQFGGAEKAHLPWQIGSSLSRF